MTASSQEYEMQTRAEGHCCLPLNHYHLLSLINHSLRFLCLCFFVFFFYSVSGALLMSAPFMLDWTRWAPDLWYHCSTLPCRIDFAVLLQGIFCLALSKSLGRRLACMTSIARCLCKLAKAPAYGLKSQKTALHYFKTMPKMWKFDSNHILIYFNRVPSGLLNMMILDTFKKKKLART